MNFRLLLFVIKNLRGIQFEKLIKIVSVTKKILNLPIRETKFRKIFDLGSKSNFRETREILPSIREIKFHENFFPFPLLPLPRSVENLHYAPFLKRYLRKLDIK